MPSAIMLPFGYRVGQLTVLKEHEQPKFIDGKRSRRKYVCRCDCGNMTIVEASRLVGGGGRFTYSCGCLQKKAITTHGETYTGTYRTWCAIIQRCKNSKNHGFKKYAAKGITVCKSWEQFENFLSDMGDRPPNTTIDRIDNSKGYFLENCRWATASQQNHNKRQPKNKNSNHYSRFQGVIKFKGKTKTTWAARIKFKKKLIYLGKFSTEIEAAHAYDEKSQEIYGLKRNFPD